MRHLPCFVYGTLMNGFHNYNYILEGNTGNEMSAMLDGYDMYSVGGFPAIVEGTGLVHGQLMYIDDKKDYEHILGQLDMLEGYLPHRPQDSMYLRAIRKVKIESGAEIEAYVYIWNEPVDKLAKVPSCDWKEYSLTNKR